MTDISAQHGSAGRSSARRNYSWRVVDIVVAALIAVAGGVIFWAWSQGANLISVPVNAIYPPLSGLYAGGWMIPAVLGMLIIRKPGAALFCETVAALREAKEPSTPVFARPRVASQASPPAITAPEIVVKTM